MSSFDGLFLEMRFSPNIEIIALRRAFVAAFYERSLFDPDTTSRVALATHELVENACKYSIGGETSLRIDLGAGRTTVRIRLSNRTLPEHIANLQERFPRMKEVPDAAEY